MSECSTETEATVSIADALVEAVRRAGAPACVGLDPVLERLPAAVARDEPLEAIRGFCLGVLDAVAGHIPCVKLQAACFERYRHAGVAVLEELIGAARQRELQVILDAKRGDIGISAAHYAASAFAAGDDAPRERLAQWITINAYFGADGITPFLDGGGGVFALVRTSNPGGNALQSQRLADGRTIAESVGELVAEVGRAYVGSSGYSAVGAVVGATQPREAVALRERMPQQVFLMPGYGAQGGGLEALAECVDEQGQGVLVSASRSVIYAEPAGGGTWQEAVADAARSMAEEVGRAAGVR
ncbi:MAG: orotidine-5'-phosphate decarboxylase [Planctomycetota bacterium]|jgi:orotidine-5'-phosphate decarboxylase